MDEGSPTYCSYPTADKRFNSVNTTKKPAPVCRIPDPPRSGRILTSTSASYTMSSWHFGEGEAKRKKRLAKYKTYTLEGKLRASIRNGFRWVKKIVHGY